METKLRELREQMRLKIIEKATEFAKEQAPVYA
jgi:hypothetical protein